MRVLRIIPAALPLAFALNIQPRANTITLDSSTTYQKIRGFGFSEAFGHSKQLYNLLSEIRQQVLDILFNTTSGAGLTILRNIITTGRIEPTSPGSPTKAPTYTWDGSDNEQSPGSAFAGPRGYLCGVSGETCSSGSWVQAYADYLTKYVRDYNSSGVAISHVGFLNEADASFSYDSMRSDGARAAQVITALRTTLDAAGFTSVLINCCDLEGWGISSTVLQSVKSSGAIDKLGGLTSHGYTGAPGAPVSSMGGSGPVFIRTIPNP